MIAATLQCLNVAASLDMLDFQLPEWFTALDFPHD